LQVLQKKNTPFSDISNSLLMYLQNSGNIFASVMSPSKETQEEITASLNSLSKTQKTKMTPSYPIPPNSFKAGGEFEDELRSSETVSSVLLTPPTSPYRNESKSTPKEEKPAEDKSQMNASTLKTLLGLDDWRCGCLTEKKRPCKNWVLGKNRRQVNSQIKSMITLTRSSPELEAELHKLVMLVHCNCHDCGDPKVSRIDDWTTAFPIGDDDTKLVVSVEKQIKRALGQLSTQCIGETVQQRCKLRIGGQKVQNCTKTIDEIVKPEVLLDDAYLDSLLEVLETNMYCHIHIDKRPLKNVALWKSSIVEIRKQADSELVQSIESKAPEGTESQTRASNNQETGSLSIKMSHELIMPNPGPSTPRNLRSLSPDFNRDPAKFWPETYDTTPFDIIEKSDRVADYKSSYTKVQSEVKKSLDSKDQKDGDVYLYEVEGNKGFVKIGYTGRSTETRHKEWSFDCNRDSKVLYPGSSTVVQNARRVEALCHAELAHRRIRIYCRSCLKQHIEWFEISPAEGIAVIQKWSKWMTTCPYQSNPPRSEWTLKKEEKQRVLDIDQFMEEISIAAESTVASGLNLEKVEAALQSLSI
jgi:hypothetical protein